MTEEPIISVKQLSKRYIIDKSPSSNTGLGVMDLLKLPYNVLRGDFFQLRNRDANSFWALKDVSFQLNRGDRLGIIGKNGAGKTTLLKILSRLIYPTEGEAVIRGRTTALFGVGTGFKPKLTGRENILYSAALHGMTKKEIQDKLSNIIEFSGIERFIDMPVAYYSKGMYSRLAFSVAAHLDPEILMLDEVLTGGDIGFQKKCLAKIEGLAGAGRTILFVSHNMNAVIRLCNRCVWIEEGRIVEDGEPREVVQSFSKRMLHLQSSYRPAADDGNRQRPPEALETDRGPIGASLVRFDICDRFGRNKEVFSRDESIHPRIFYQVLRDDIAIVPVVHLYHQGVLVFTTHPSQLLPAPPGSECLAETEIPGKLLNTGEYDFSLALVTPARPKWRHVYLENILSIKIVPENDDRRIFSGDYRGCIRPDLAWKASITTP